MTTEIDVYAGRFAGSFDLNHADGASLGHDSTVVMRVEGVVKKVTLEDTRTGEMRLFYVIRPSAVRLDRDDTAPDPNPPQPPAVMAPVQPEAIVQPEAVTAATRVLDMLDEFDEEAQAPPALPRGERVSTVQPHSNVAGSSQSERDSVLHDFLYGDSEE